jgi:integrase
MVRHSHQDALSEQEFEQLWNAAGELRQPFDQETRFILVAAGRLGLRAAEITHMRESWIDWEREMIEIPSFQNCSCGYCKSQSRQSVQKTGVSYDEAVSRMWSPKTENSARAVPFDFNDRVADEIRAFFFSYEGWPKSRSAVNRRVDNVAEAAGWKSSRVYPHSLRATAATWHAYAGTPAPALQSLFGWAKISVAQKYLRLSGSATAEALRAAHGD